MRIAVTSRSFSRHPILRRELQSAHAHVTFNDEGISLKGESLRRFLTDHDAAITALEVIDNDLLSSLPELKVISKYGVGVDMLDLDAMLRHHVKLGWTGGVNKRSVSELVISFAIALLRHVPSCSREVENGIWRQHVGRHLSERTVGIIGCGHVGKDLAVILRAFGCRVLAYDILDFPDFYRSHKVEPMSLENLLQQADVVSIHTPLNKTTRNLLNAERLAFMKPDAILINAARGGLIDEDALEAMLKNGCLGAAAVDVFNVEPPNRPSLIALPNFIATPHIGGSAEEAILAMGRAAIVGLTEACVPDTQHPARKA